MDFRALGLLVGLLVAGPATADILLAGARIVDVENGKLLPSQDILLRDGRIVAIGADLDRKDGVEVIDVAGRYVMPGLIDSHVHVGHPIGLRDEDFEERPALVKAFFDQVPRSYLYFGFTTLIDLDMRPQDRARFEMAAVHPEIHSCGRGIRLKDGYGPAMFPARLRDRIFPNWVYNDDQAGTLNEAERESHQPANLVRATAKDGAICIKSYFERGFGGTFDWPVPEPATLKGIADAATAEQLPFLLHATSLEAYQRGLDAGVNVFAHTPWHAKTMSGPLPADELAAVMTMVAARGIFVQSSLGVTRGEVDTLAWNLEKPELRHALAPDMLAWLATEDGRWARRDLEAMYDKLKPDPSRANTDYMEMFEHRAVQAFRAAKAAGVPIILGSDTPASEGVGNVPGWNGLEEIRSMHRAGYPLIDIARAATIRNAQAFGLQGDVGSVAVGKRANLLILQGNPLTDVESYNKIEQVVLGGHVYARDRFSAAETARLATSQMR